MNELGWVQRLRREPFEWAWVGQLADWLEERGDKRAVAIRDIEWEELGDGRTRVRWGGSCDYSWMVYRNRIARISIADDIIERLLDYDQDGKCLANRYPDPDPLGE